MPAGPSVVVRVGEARRDRLVLLMARLNGADRLVLACEACPGDQALPAPAAAVGDNRSPACGAVRPAGRRAPRGPGRGARSRTRPVREPPCSTPPSARVPALNEDLVVTPNEFITKWRASELKERSASQEHFIDLCRLLGEPTPADADPTGETYCFERGARRDAGGDGWADVWKRHHFAWEYKGRRANLDAAFNQLRQYALALENPPLLIVSDMVRFRIRTNWTNSVSRTHEFELDDLADAATRDRLKWAFSDPERLRPGETRQSLTERVAASFASVAQALRERGHDPQAVAHFVNRLVFCMFADDVGLLPDHMFTRMLRHALPAPARFGELAGELFRAMASGGRVGFETVAWFNGSLFNDATTLPLERTDIETVLAASDLDWSEVDPSILGTLFERGLDPGKRAQLGAHYTDRDKIMLLVEPVVIRPLLAEWDAEKTEITAELERAEAARSRPARTKRLNEAERRYRAFLNRLRGFTVLDPACGSGNFLYLALQALKDLEHRVQLEAEALGFHRAFPEIGPANVKGIEINPYAAELARVSVWIGEIQWMRRNGFGEARDPILKPLDTIECRDAILTPDNLGPEWPAADVVIGNPPFLGTKLQIRKLGEDYVSRLRTTHKNLVPAGADLVCYWFVMAGRQLASGKAARAGLVATNSIRGGWNLPALQAATGRHRIDLRLDSPFGRVGCGGGLAGAHTLRGGLSRHVPGLPRHGGRARLLGTRGPRNHAGDRAGGARRERPAGAGDGPATGRNDQAAHEAGPRPAHPEPRGPLRRRPDRRGPAPHDRTARRADLPDARPALHGAAARGRRDQPGAAAGRPGADLRAGTRSVSAWRLTAVRMFRGRGSYVPGAWFVCSGPILQGAPVALLTTNLRAAPDLP